MKRLIGVAAIAVFLVGVVGSPPAQALTKERTEIPLNDHTPYSGFCPFTVYETDTGRVFQDVWLDAEGNLVKIAIYSPGVKSTFEANGKSVTFPNSGPVFVTVDENGIFSVQQRGQSVSADQGVITGDAFLVHVSGSIISHTELDQNTGFQDYIDTVRTGVVTDICAALAA
jgi:hypothetical protein